jgi:hypothetical protein
LSSPLLNLTHRPLRITDGRIETVADIEKKQISVWTGKLVLSDENPKVHQGTVSPKQWPPTVRHLGPRAVRATPHGLYIVRDSFFVEERGIFVLRTSSTFRPKEGADPSFRQLTGHVYWYEIKG